MMDLIHFCSRLTDNIKLKPTQGGGLFRSLNTPYIPFSAFQAAKFRPFSSCSSTESLKRPLLLSSYHPVLASQNIRHAHGPLRTCQLLRSRCRIKSQKQFAVPAAKGDIHHGMIWGNGVYTADDQLT